MGKYFLVCLVAIFTMASCSKDDSQEISAIGLFGKWKLTKMSSSWVNSETTGSDMEWQEVYVFNADSTFSKSREWNEEVSTAAGKLSIKKWHTGEEYILLSYNGASDIVGSCYGNDQEELYLTTKNKLSSTWSACDGPGLDYNKVD